jgi:hypothetical protein
VFAYAGKTDPPSSSQILSQTSAGEKVAVKCKGARSKWSRRAAGIADPMTLSGIEEKQ